MPKKKPAPKPPTNVFFHSTRDLTLRFVTFVTFGPVPFLLWLLTLPPTDGWDDSPVGPTLWWLLPVFLVALILAMPLAMLLLHDRYVLHLERDEVGTWRLTTWMLWGRRTRVLTSAELSGADLKHEAGEFDSRLTVSVDAPYLRVRLASGKRLIFDAQCEAPHGWDAIEGLFARRQPRQ